MKCSCGATKGVTETCYNGYWGYYDSAMATELFNLCNSERQAAQYVEYDAIGNIVYNGNVQAVSRDSSLDALAISRAVEVLSSWSHKHSVNDKVKLHRVHGTTLIYTFSKYKDKRNLLKHLQEKLETAGFELTPRSNKEIMDKLISSEESRYVRKLVNLICRFITNFKTNGFDADEFDRMYHSTTNVRSRLFLNICQDCYLEYQRYLKENNAVDFEDMINESARVLRQVKEMKEKLHFKYIIVDEYEE